MGKEGKIEKNKGNEGSGLEMNEEFKKIDEVLKKYKDKEVDQWGQYDNWHTEEYSKDRQAICDNLPKAITNNELPERFYITFYETDYIKFGEPAEIGDFFNGLELMEIYKYHERMEEFLEMRPWSINMSGVKPYDRENYDGGVLSRGNIFKDYSIEEKASILETNQGVFRFLTDLMTKIQGARLDFDSNDIEKMTNVIADPGIKAVRMMAEISDERWVSKKIMNESRNLYDEMKLARGMDIKDEHGNIIKRGREFPNEEVLVNELSRLKEMMLKLISEMIAEVKQKMKDNYESTLGSMQ